jgi:protein-S-isoprenylcysteine O-methyltransferase Ste14
MTRFDRLFVWTGGALFIASLATVAWWYAGPLGRANRAPGTSTGMALALDAVLFSVFALHHSLFARTPLKNAVARLVPASLLRSIYVWIASLLLVTLCALWQPVGGVLYDANAWLTVVLVIVQLTGLGLIARSVAAIDPLELAGIRHTDADKEPSPLQTTGPYRLVRHPLYLGWMLIVFGPALLTGDRLAFAAFSSFYLVVAIPWEERSLTAAFGQEYVRYTRQVRWRVIPYVY